MQGCRQSRAGVAETEVRAADVAAAEVAVAEVSRAPVAAADVSAAQVDVADVAAAEVLVAEVGEAGVEDRPDRVADNAGQVGADVGEAREVAAVVKSGELVL